MREWHSLTRDGVTMEWRELALVAVVGAAVGLTALATKVERADRWGMLAVVAATALTAREAGMRRAEQQRTERAAAEEAQLHSMFAQASGLATVTPLSDWVRAPVS